MKRWAPLAAVPFLLSGCLAIGPGEPYKDGQVVDVSVTQFAAGGIAWLSECAPGQTPTVATGCGTTLHGQPSVHLDGYGGGSGHFRVAGTVGGISCGGYCTIVATNGKRLQTVPISFDPKGSIGIAVANNGPVYLNGAYLQNSQQSHGFTTVTLAPGIYTVDVYADTKQPGDLPVSHSVVLVEAGKGTAIVVVPVSNHGYSTTVTPVPPPPAPGRVRVTFVNQTPIALTPRLGSVTGPVLPAGKSTTLTLTGPSDVADGQDPWGASYPSTDTPPTTCGNGGAAGLTRGTGYVLTIVTPPDLSNSPSCPYTLYPVVQQRAG